MSWIVVARLYCKQAVLEYREETAGRTMNGAGQLLEHAPGEVCLLGGSGYLAPCVQPARESLRAWAQPLASDLEMSADGQYSMLRPVKKASRKYID